MSENKVRELYNSSIKHKYTAGPFLSWLLFILIMLLLINAALPQVEILLFSGTVPIPSISIKLAIVIVISVYSITHINYSLNKTSAITLVLLLSFFVIETALFLILGHYPILVLVFGYNAMYFLLALALVMTNFRSTISSKPAEVTLLFISIPIIILGISQTLLNKPLIPTKSVGGYFTVLVWNYYGQVRAFSLFDAPAYYSTFLIFIGGILLSHTLTKGRFKKRLFYFLLFTIVVFSEIMTLNRAGIFAFMFAMFVVIAIYRNSYGKTNLFLVMVCSLCASIALTFAVPVISKAFPYVFAFKDQSMFERYAEWVYWLQAILENPQKLLFGSGLFQDSMFRVTKKIIIDNLFLAVMVQFGIIGLAIILFIIYKIWEIMVSHYLYAMAPMSIACIALFTVWPIFAMFGTGLNLFPIYGALTFLIVRPDSVARPFGGKAA